MKEREIGLVDLIFEILLHWRAIVVAMLVGMFLLGSFSFVNSYRTFKAQETRVEVAKQKLEQEMKDEQEIKDEQEQDEIIQVSKKWLEQRLTDQQKYNVNYALTFEEVYHEKVKYVENSVLMQMDPNSVKRAEVTFLVTADDKNKTYDIVKVYEDLVRSGELFNAIAEKTEVSVSDINEILTLEKESYNVKDGVDTVRIRVIHSDMNECSAIMQAIIAYLEEKTAELVKIVGNHDLTLLTQSLVVVSDTNVMSQQRSFLSDIFTLESVVTNTKNNFTEIEWKYYDFLINGKLTDLSASKTDTATSQATGADIETEEGEALTDIINKGVTIHPEVSVSHVILGAVLAAFVYVFIVFVLYILNGKIRVTDKLQELYMIPQLGVITKSEKSTRFLGFVDDWIISLRDRNKRKFIREEAINLAAVAVKMAARKDDLISICLIGCDLKEQTLAVCDQMKAVLDNDNITVEILNNILYDAQAMSKLQAAQGAVLVETAGSTLYAEIAQELEILKRQDIKVLGGIVVE